MNVYGNVLWYLYFYANCNAHTQILRTVKDFAELFTFLPAFESNVPFLGAMSHILGVELGLTGLTSTSRSSRTTCSKSLAVFVSNDSSLSVLRSGLLTFFSSLVI